MVTYEELKAENGKILVLNPNNKVVQNIKRRCEINEGYCPCSPEKSEKTMCPCEAVRTNGECHCGLYVELLTECFLSETLDENSIYIICSESELY